MNSKEMPSSLGHIDMAAERLKNLEMSLTDSISRMSALRERTLGKGDMAKVGESPSPDRFGGSVGILHAHIDTVAPKPHTCHPFLRIWNQYDQTIQSD